MAAINAIKQGRITLRNVIKKTVNCWNISLETISSQALPVMV